MKSLTIYHNPRCTKSRQTLSLLTGKGIEPTVVEYLNAPPDEKTLAGIVRKLGIAPRELVRRKEFRELGVDEPRDDAGWIRLMVENPRLIERPIVVSGSKAAIGRPPEKVLELL